MNSKALKFSFMHRTYFSELNVFQVSTHIAGKQFLKSAPKVNEEQQKYANHCSER